MVPVLTFQYHEIYDSCKTEFFMKMTIQLPFIYEKPLASTTNFLLLGLILAYKLSGVLTKLSANELCILTCSFQCCIYSGVQGNTTLKTELGLGSFEHMKSNSLCSAKHINLLVRKLMKVHFLEEYMSAFY